VLNIEKYKK